MGKLYDALTPDLRAWLGRQRIFFVATAPLSVSGHVNCSPKGGDTFRVVGEREAAYLDLTGSGIETAAHVQENGRIVLMFCAFEGPPKIVRVHGEGEVIYPEDSRFAGLAQEFGSHRGVRAIIRVSITRISDSCGYSVPLYAFIGDRDALDRWAQQKGDDGLAAYRQEKNRASIDGVPGYVP
ncbi:MAG TPA: pyridoxamine 5'-phosphate oxidase family protein [Verrucomicrobiales bacterium]|nr:pyridoxamine 5'-phosphate oxidase family protein [Verrucomicrobiales bacterium]